MAMAAGACAGTTRVDGYARRAPEETLLHRVVQEHWPKFRELAEERGGPSRHPWPWLLKRVFAVDITACPKCTGRMRVIEVAEDEEDAARVLSELGMSARAPPPRAVARRVHPRQLSLSFAG